MNATTTPQPKQFTPLPISASGHMSVSIRKSANLVLAFTVGGFPGRFCFSWVENVRCLIKSLGIIDLHMRERRDLVLFLLDWASLNHLKRIRKATGLGLIGLDAVRFVGLGEVAAK